MGYNEILLLYPVFSATQETSREREQLLSDVESHAYDLEVEVRLVSTARLTDR